MLSIHALVAAGVATALTFVGCNPSTPRETRPRQAVQLAEDAGFHGAAVTGEPKMDGEDRIIEQPVAVIVGKTREDYNSARAKECWATVFVRWDPAGNTSLTLESRNKVTQEDTDNDKALTLDDYEGCDTH